MTRICYTEREKINWVNIITILLLVGFEFLVVYGIFSNTEIGQVTRVIMSVIFFFLVLFAIIYNITEYKPKKERLYVETEKNRGKKVCDDN